MQLFYVLINQHGQHASWPEQLALPKGWCHATVSSSKQACQDYVQREWQQI